MEVSKLTTTLVNGAKTITRNPNDTCVLTCLYSAPKLHHISQPKLWDGSQDILELGKKVSINDKPAFSHIACGEHDKIDPYQGVCKVDVAKIIAILKDIPKFPEGSIGEGLRRINITAPHPDNAHGYWDHLLN